MERVDQLSDSSCSSVNSEPSRPVVKGSKEFFDRFYTNPKESLSEKDGRKILSQRRTRLTDNNFQKQLFANINYDLPEFHCKKLRLE